MLYAIYRIGIFLGKVLPKRLFSNVLAFGALVQHYRSKRDRDIVRNNLAGSVGLAGAELKRAAKLVFMNFGRYLADFFDPKMETRYIAGVNVDIIGLEHVDTALKKGKGCIFLSGHYGNWEIGGCVMARLGYKIHSVVLEHEDRRINDFFRTRRHGAGQKMIPLGKAGKLCPKVFARNEILAILGDRIFGGKGVGIDFFGKPARFPRGAAVFGIRYECPIIPIFIFRSGRERYTVEFMGPLVPNEGLSFKDSVADMTQQYADVFQGIISRDPTQWYMFKDVWE